MNILKVFFKEKSRMDINLGSEITLMLLYSGFRSTTRLFRTTNLVASHFELVIKSDIFKSLSAFALRKTVNKISLASLKIKFPSTF